MRFELALILVAMTALSPVASSAESLPLSDRREILASGDRVDGLGRIGIFGFGLQGLDDSGRVLASGFISDGRVGLYRAEPASLEVVWSSSASDAVLLRPLSAQVTRSGLVAVQSNDGAIYLIDDGAPQRLIGSRDRDSNGEILRGPDGEIFCYVELPGSQAAFSVNDSGTVAFLAEVALDGQSCEGTEEDDYAPRLVRSIYTVEVGKEPRPVVRETPFVHVSAPLNFGSLTDEGEVVFTASVPAAKTEAAEAAIFAGTPEASRILVRNGSIGPRGGSLEYIELLAVSRRGDLLLRATEDGTADIFRVVDGEITSVGTSVLLAPNGSTLYGGRVVSMNDGGDIATTGEWYETDEPPRVSSVILHRRDGSTSLLRDAIDARLNDSGELAFFRSRFNQRSELFRQAEGAEVRVLADGDPAPGGGYFGVQGIDGKVCLGNSGVVGTDVQASDGRQALACGGDGGFALAAKAGDVAANGQTVVSPAGCHVLDSGEMLFVGWIAESVQGALISRLALFRSSSAGIESVLTPNELGITDSAFQFQTFAANAAGTVVVHVPDDDSGTFYRMRRGEALQALPVRDFRRPGLHGAVITHYGLADDESIVVGARLEGHGRQPLDQATAIAVFSGIDGRVKTSIGDSRLVGAPFDYFDELFVAGDLAVFKANRPNARAENRVFRFRLGDAAPPQEILPGDTGLFDPTVTNVTPGGRVLFSAYPDAFHSPPRQYILDADGAHELGLESYADYAEAINDRGNVLLRTYEVRESLSLSGPRVEATCVVPPFPSGQPTSTPTIPAGSSSSGCSLRQGGQPLGGWLVVLGLAIALRKFRRRWARPPGSERGFREG